MSKTNELLTCCGDVELLYHVKGDLGERSFSLCKTLVLEDTKRNASGKWCYMLIVENDHYPIIITEECANTILENPEQGKFLVYNRWMDRYR